MKTDLKKPWIAVGYECFAKEGPKGLKIEQIARQVNKSKSSFYHLFADLEIFTRHLLDYHLSQAEVIADRAKLCKNMAPDMINLLLDIKQDILFNRQLRVNRHVPGYTACFEKANQPIEEAFLNIWADALQLSDQPNIARILLNLTIENFYLQVTEENLTYAWLLQYLEGIQTMSTEITKVKS